MDVTLISRYFDSRNRGAGTYSELIYESLRNRNIPVKTISQDDALINIDSSRWSYYFYTTLDLKRLINKSEYKNSDVFHSLSPIESFYVPKNKCVTTILDFIPLQNDTVKSSLVGKYYAKSVLSAIKSERVIVINSDLKKYLVSNYDIDESVVEVVVPIVNDKYYPIEKENDTFVVGTVSELALRKRVDILINSFLKADIENSKLLIGGSGPELENLKKLADNDERIEFLGFIPDDDMNSFYNSLDVFVFPSAAEGYGLPIVEAMACKKPVITLEDSDIPSDLKEKTCVCRKDELSDVLLNRTYSCNLNRNLEFYKEHSSENICSKLLSVYESI